VERKVKTEMTQGRGGALHTAGMERGAGEAWDEAGCGSENTSRVDPSDQGSAVVDPSVGLQVKKGGRCTETTAQVGGRTDGAVLDVIRKRVQGDGVEGTWCACGEWGCVDVHQRRGHGTAARRDGGEVVRVQQQGWVGLQERDADIVWSRSKRRRVRTDGAEVEARLNECVASQGTQVWVLQRRAPEQNWHPCQHRSWHEYGCGIGAWPQGECGAGCVCPHAAGAQRRAQLEVRQNG
jgi:hypothetical protein